MSKIQLKKHLAALTKEEVIALVLNLYDVKKRGKRVFGIYSQPRSGGSDILTHIA